MMIIMIAAYGTPVLAIIFCLNLVSIIKKVNKGENEDVSVNTFLMTGAFTIMVSCITYSLLFTTSS